MQPESTSSLAQRLAELSIESLQRLTWLQTKIEAAEWLANHDHVDRIDYQLCKRLAFTRHLIVTRRLSEFGPVKLDEDWS